MARRKKSQVNQSLTGCRITHQRALLLDLIEQARGHLDADELHRRARLKDPSISLSTVYRNLALFKRLNLIQERHFSEEHHHYEVSGSADHHHLICLGCGEVIEFTSPLTQQMRRAVARAKGFTVTDVEVKLAGYCARCRPLQPKKESKGDTK